MLNLIEWMLFFAFLQSKEGICSPPHSCSMKPLGQLQYRNDSICEWSLQDPLFLQILRLQSAKGKKKKNFKQLRNEQALSFSEKMTAQRYVVSFFKNYRETSLSCSQLLPSSLRDFFKTREHIYLLRGASKECIAKVKRSNSLHDNDA